MTQPTLRKLSLLEHLDELRKRIIISLLFVLAASIFSYFFAKDILFFLAGPIGDLIFISPQEAFLSYVKVSLLCGLILSSPFVLFQAWQFIGEGLNQKEIKNVLWFTPLSFFFFIIGAAFGFFVIVPIGLKFLLGFATDFMIPMITVSRYISFIGMLTLSFGIVFELPVAAIFLTKIGIVTPTFLSSKRRYAVVLIFIVAALLTPPDIITQCLMAIPLLLLYELSIVFSRLAYKNSSYNISKQ